MMALEGASYINDLVTGNPPGTDSKSQGDDHIRLIKTVLKNTFPLAIGPLKFRDDSGTGTSIAPLMTLYRNSASPLNNDLLGGFYFNGKDSALVERNFARIYIQATDVAAAGPDGAM